MSVCPTASLLWMLTDGQMDRRTNKQTEIVLLCIKDYVEIINISNQVAVDNVIINIDNYLDPPFGDLFLLLANCFLLFCSYLAVLIFPSLLVGFQKPNLKCAQDPRVGDIQLFNRFPLYCLNLISIQISSLSLRGILHFTL